MPKAPSVLVACEDLVLLDEVIRYLEEIPHWQLVRSARSVPDLLNLPSPPDCVLISDLLAGQLATHPGFERLSGGIVVFARQESLPGLRAAIELNAAGFVEWPEQRDRLRGLVERDAGSPAPAQVATGAMHAVWAPKGGAGASVVAAHLAGALATLNRKTILVDLDLANADQTSLLGAEAGTKSVADLLRVADELNSETVRSVLWHHPLGFDAVLAPGAEWTGDAKESAVRRVLNTVRSLAEHVVVDLPSGLGPVTVAGLRDAGSLFAVLTPDLLSLKRARDSLKRLRAQGVLRDDVRVVLNQAGGADITQKEVQAVLGSNDVVRLRADYKIYRVVNRGELSPVACKLLAPLARTLAAAHPAPPARTAPEAPEAAVRVPGGRAEAGLAEPARPRPVPRQRVPAAAGTQQAERLPARWPVKGRS